MQADEQIRVMRLGKTTRSTSSTRLRRWVRVRKTCQPLVSSNGASRSAQSSVNSFSNRPSENAVGADIDAAMAGINHDDAIAIRQRRPEQQRLNIFLQIKAVDENLVVNEFRGEPELISVSFQLASRLPMAKTIVPFAVPIA